jgi:DNA-binding transcriptional regulator YbjK
MAPMTPTDAPYAGRRLELVRAAETVVARGGLRALTHRAVDSAAGLPLGSCSSYFRTRLALLTALAEYVGHALTVEVHDLGEHLRGLDGADPEAHLDASVAEVVALFRRRIDNPDLVLSQAELTLESLRQPDLKKSLDHWRTGLVAMVETMVAHAGRPDPRQRAETLVAAMQGVLLNGLQQPEGERTGYLERSIRMLLAGSD